MIEDWNILFTFYQR